ncbi:hypothetical protein Tco_1239376 [Tanacetum coccineum]
MGLWYPKDSQFELISYSDVDHAGCKDDCKSTLGGLQFLSGKLMSWSSEKQDCTAMSTAEAKYVSLSACCAQVIWMRTQLLDYEYKYNWIPMYCDSKSAIAISCNPVQHSKTKHIDIRYHFIKEHVEKLIIMAHQQHAVDVHLDELCPPNKRYDLMDANKKVDLEHIYMAQFWHTLKEDGSNYRVTFLLDKKELSLTLDDFRTIFYLPQANGNNHDSFVPPPSFLDMVSFYKQQLGFTMELKTSSSFRTTGLLQPWQTLCKIFPNLLWEGLHYSLNHPTSLIPYPRFTKIIINHYMTSFPEISRRRYKDRVGMKIPDWMISEEMKYTEHYRMFAKVFGLDFPLTQLQPTESTQGTHRTPSAPRRSTRLTPPAPVPTVDKADEMLLQDTLQVSLSKLKSQEEQEARENVELVNEHLASVEIDKMVEGSENVIDDSSTLRNDETNILGTKLKSKSDKESPEVETTNDNMVKITNDEEVEITNVVIPVNVNEEEEEITDEVYELKQREKRKIVEESRSTPFPTPIRSPRIHTNLVSSDTNKLQELTETTPSSSSPNTNLSKTNQLLSLFRAKPARFKHYKSFFQELQGLYEYLFGHLKVRFLSRKSFDTLVDHLQEVMVESLPIMVDTHIKEQVKKQVPKQAEFSSQIQKAIDNHIPSQVDASGDPNDDAHPKGENRAKRQKSSEYEAYVFGESSSGQVNGNEQDDDEIPTKQMSQDIMEEVSLTIDEAKLKKMVDEMLRQRCTLRDEHQYHID